MSKVEKVEIDNSTPESFARSILPWLSKKTGLKYNPDMALPNIITLDGPFIVGGAWAAGVYTPEDNEIAVDINRGQMEAEATLTHELVHWLQDINGLLDENISTVKEIEKQAYYTQRAFYEEIAKVNPDEKLPKDFIERVTNIS